MTITQWRQIISADLRKVLAEPLFWFLLLAPILLGWMLHYVLPYLAGLFQNFSLADYYPLVLALIILTPPLYYGLILGLQVLEEKDEGVLIAVAVTPMPLRTYLFTRTAMYTLISLPLIIVVHRIIGVVEIGTGEMFWVAVAAALNAPMAVMLLAAFCKNLLEGFVIGKGMSPLILLPLAMFFVPDYWHVLCGVLPTYWPIIAYFTAVDPAGSATFFYVAIAMSIVTQPLATLWLYRRFARDLVS